MSSYHGWTHAPKEEGGTDPIPVLTAGAYPYIYRELLPADNSQTQLITHSNAGTILVLDAASNPGIGTGASTVVEYGDGGEDYFEPDAFDPDATVMTLSSQMRCYFSVQIKWEATFVGGTNLRFHSGAWGWYKSISYEEPGGTLGNGGNSPLFYFETRMPGGESQFTVQVENWSGANRYIESAVMEIGIINAFTGNANIY